MLRQKPKARLFTALALAVLTCTASPARAQPAPTEAALAQARERFATARKLEDTGHWAEALTAFQRVAEVKLTPQVRFHIALCLENVGLWGQALDVYAQAATEAGAAAPDVVKESGEHVRKLERAMPTVTLRVEGAAADDQLYLDRRRIARDDRALPLRADPGPHTAEVWRDGAVVAREYFALSPKTTRRIALRIGTVAASAAGIAGGAGGELAPSDPGAEPSRGHVQRAVGWTAVGVGSVSLALAGVFIGLRSGARDRLDAACPTLKQCPMSVQPIVHEGKTDATLVNTFSILGGVAAVAGVVLVVTAPSAAPSSARLEIAPLAGLGGVGLTARGIF